MKDTVLAICSTGFLINIILLFVCKKIENKDTKEMMFTLLVIVSLAYLLLSVYFVLFTY